jgi:hypothetical protein
MTPTDLTTPFHLTPHRSTAMPITTEIPTKPFHLTPHRSHAMPTTTETQTEPFHLTSHRSHAMPITTEIQTEPFHLTPHRSHAMPTTAAVAVPRHTTRIPTTTPTKETPMTAALSFHSALVTSLAIVQSAPPAANETALLPSPLRASQVRSVAEEELAFFFTSKVDNDAWNDDDDTWTEDEDDSVRARQVIGDWIATLSDRDQDALSLYFDREPWPASVKREEIACSGGYALLLALASPYDRRWSNGPHRHAHLREISVQLEAAVQKHGPVVLRHLARQSEWSFTTALRAYIHARGRAPSVLGPQGPGHKEAQ